MKRLPSDEEGTAFSAGSADARPKRPLFVPRAEPVAGELRVKTVPEWPGQGSLALPQEPEAWLALAAEVGGDDRLLSEEERKRAFSIGAGPRRDEFMAGRIFLRRLLAAFLDKEPKTIELTMTPEGKPCLAGPDAGRLEFSLAHTTGVIAAAFAPAPVGVDVEAVARLCDEERLSARFFHPHEHSAIREALRQDSRMARALFFRWWTVKEALAKAHGTGLAGRLAACNLSGWRQGPCARIVEAQETFSLFYTESTRLAFALAARGVVEVATIHVIRAHRSGA